MPGRRRQIREEPVYLSDPHTRIKHRIYRGYLDCWMPKVLQAIWNDGAVIVDAFSGAGYYKDGLDGSPLLVAKAYMQHQAVAGFNPLTLVTLEQRKDRTDMLRSKLAELPNFPRLSPDVQPSGEFDQRQAALAAKYATGRTPVLWLLDPYGLNQIPFSAVTACIAPRGSEAIVTLMLDEMHRFKSIARFEGTMNALFGGDSWKAAVHIEDESQSKDALIAIYQQRLKSLGRITARFDVRVSNRTPRYALILVTGHTAGLKCWNPVAWNLDPNAGVGASIQGELHFGPDLDRLIVALQATDGEELSWDDAAALAMKTGYTVPLLREALGTLAELGLAERISPAASRTPWPEGSRIRVFAEIDEAEPPGDLDA
jgi:three-Cys-motif partner protein